MSQSRTNGEKNANGARGKRTGRWWALASAGALAAATAGSGPWLKAQSTPAAPSMSAEAPAGASLVRGSTVPKATHNLRFPIRGVVATVAKQKGDLVKKGELILKLDDAEQMAQLKARELDADVALAVAEAEQEYRVAVLTFQKTEKGYANKVSTEIELETDRARMEIAKLKIDQAKRQGAIAAAQADASRAIVEQMSMESPIDGVIVDILSREGEGVDESRDVVQVIDVTKLFVEVRLADIQSVRKLRVGQTLRVQFVDEPGKWIIAKINFISPAGDAKAGTLPFRLEIDNPDHRPPGEDVEVEMPGGGVATR